MQGRPVWETTVLAHELGHLDQHQAIPKGRAVEHLYSNVSKENSSEWQADEFAFHFLCPRNIIIQYKSVADIMDFCLVSEDYAQRAFDQYITFASPRQAPKSLTKFSPCSTSS